MINFLETNKIICLNKNEIQNIIAILLSPCILVELMFIFKKHLKNILG